MTSDIETAQAAMLDKFEFQALAREKMRAAIRSTFATLLEEEVSAFIGAQRYECTDTRRDRRNGSYPRDLGTSAGPITALAIPRTRQGFQTQLFERYHRRQAELDKAIGDMFVYGTSTTRVGFLWGQKRTQSGHEPEAHSTVVEVVGRRACAR